MNKAIENIKNRRSIRGFDPSRRVSDENLREILDCAMYAPLAMNKVLWHFSAVQNSEIINGVAEKTIGVMKINPNEHTKMRLAMPNFSPFYGAPTVIFVFAEKGNPFAQSNCGAAMQNMLLAAEALGLNTCWIGMANRYLTLDEAQPLLKKIGMPDGYEIVGCVALGYALNAAKMPNKHFDERDNIVSIIK